MLVDTSELPEGKSARFQELLVGYLASPPLDHDWTLPQMSKFTIDVIAAAGIDPYSDEHAPGTPPPTPRSTRTVCGKRAR